MRLQGTSVQDIAQHFDLDPAYIWREIQESARYLDTSKQLDTIINTGYDRLESLWKVFYPVALSGDRDALESCLKIHDRIVRLVGAEAPKRFDARLIIQQWAEKEGLDPVLVIETVAPLLPSA